MRAEKSSKALYKDTVKNLTSVYDEKESRQLARLLMEEVFGLSLERILIDEPVDADLQTYDLFNTKIELLLNHTPIQYVLGKAHFYGREFTVTPDVLIPRQETEELVREIIDENPAPELKILDIGAGSGCIGITLALAMRHPRITLLDVDHSTLEIAFENAAKFDVDLEYILDDILIMDHLPEKYHIIVSNPPYVTEGEKKLMHSNVLEFEPKRALFVPDDNPFIFYKKIIELAGKHLFPGGKVYFEINEHFGNEMVRLCEKGGCSCIRLFQDINGKDRFLKARFD